MSKPTSTALALLSKLTDELTTPTAPPAAPPEPLAYSRKEFCRLYGISTSLYLKLHNSGLGPAEMDLNPHGQRARPRITAEAARAWQAKMVRKNTGGRHHA